MKQCVIEECSTERWARGLCVRHYTSCRNAGTLDELWATSQPKGQRAIDKYEWAIQIIERYREDIETGKITGSSAP